MTRAVPFGEFLVQMQVVSRNELFMALSWQDRRPGCNLGTAISELGLAPRVRIEQLHRAYFAQLFEIRVLRRVVFDRATGSLRMRTVTPTHGPRRSLGS